MPLQFIRKSFSSLDDYKRHREHIDASKDFKSICPLDLVRQCISLSDFCRHKVSARGIRLFVEFIDFALTPSFDGFFKCTDDYKYQEPTVKAAVTTIIGLTSAKYVAEKDWGIPRLLHCKELNSYFRMGNCIYSATNSRFIPDFFGVDDNDEGYLFEAKGSGIPSNSVKGNSRKDTNRLQHAIDDQLTSIRGIRTPSKSYVIGKSSAYVVEGGFRDNIFMISDIDPSPISGIEMMLNPAEAYINYYSAFLDNRITSTNSSPVRIEGKEYDVFPIPGTEYSMGVVKDLPNAVRELAKAYESFTGMASGTIDRYGFRGAVANSGSHLGESREKASLATIRELENNDIISTETTHRALRKEGIAESVDLAQQPTFNTKTLKESLTPVMPADAYGYIEEAYQSTIQRHRLIEEIDQITSEIEPATTKDYSIGPDGFALFRDI